MAKTGRVEHGRGTGRAGPRVNRSMTTSARSAASSFSTVKSHDFENARRHERKLPSLFEHGKPPEVAGILTRLVDRGSKAGRGSFGVLFPDIGGTAP